MTHENPNSATHATACFAAVHSQFLGSFSFHLAFYHNFTKYTKPEIFPSAANYFPNSVSFKEIILLFIIIFQSNFFSDVGEKDQNMKHTRWRRIFPKNVQWCGFPGSTPFYWWVSVKFVWLMRPFPETTSAHRIDSSHFYTAIPTNAWATRHTQPPTKMCSEI